MKQTKMEQENGNRKSKWSIPPPPPPPPPLPRFWTQKYGTESVTNQEIAKFWRKKHIEEEGHLLAAIKAAARIRARNFTEEDYLQFEDSLKDDDATKDSKEDKSNPTLNKDEENKEVRIGIKDWWTKSKFAYLNQPAVATMDPPKKRSSNYIPNCFSFKSTPLYPTSLGVF